jgi:hypothetical protein
MTKFVYNANSMNRKAGTAHRVESRTGDVVQTKCGLELTTTRVFDTENGDVLNGKCGNCTWE